MAHEFVLHRGKSLKQFLIDLYFFRTIIYDNGAITSN